MDASVDRKLNKSVEKLLKSATSEGIIPIVAAGEPVLRAQADLYTGQLSRKTFARLIDVMYSTMLAAPGVGLAAPQIGLSLRFAVVEDHVDDVDDDVVDSEADNDDDLTDPREFAEFPFHVIINPQYVPATADSERVSFYEGCLSVPGFQAVRSRWRDIIARWDDEKGAHHEEHLHGWPARIFQHETDHLSGELYLDQAEIRSLTTDENLSDLWFDPDLTQASEALGFSLK